MKVNQKEHHVNVLLKSTQLIMSQASPVQFKFCLRSHAKLFAGSWFTKIACLAICSQFNSHYIKKLDGYRCIALNVNRLQIKVGNHDSASVAFRDSEMANKEISFCVYIKNKGDQVKIIKI